MTDQPGATEPESADYADGRGPAEPASPSGPQGTAYGRAAVPEPGARQPAVPEPERGPVPPPATPPPGTPPPGALPWNAAPPRGMPDAPPFGAAGGTGVPGGAAAARVRPPGSPPPSGYVFAEPQLPPPASGLASGGLASGVGSCVLGLVGCCWWPLASLPFVMGLGGIVLGSLGLRQVTASRGEITGRPLAIWAIASGAAGVLLTGIAVVAGLILRADGGSLLR